MKRIVLFLLMFISYRNGLGEEKVVAEGMAIIGSGITLEEAKVIALNDAQQNALNSLGVFIESFTQVENYRLTKDEIKSITGAIIKSEIIESEKVIVNNAFVLKIKAEFTIDQESMRVALRNYQDKSKDKKTIQHLTETIQELRRKLLMQDKTDYRAYELVDEINFNNKRLGEILTTRQTIDNELEIQEIYKQNVQ